METEEKLLRIGLFGSCGTTNWRNSFIETYKSLDIDFFNPQLPPGEWEKAPEHFAEMEAMNLACDQIILFPVLADTYGLGSLGETGFSILNAIRLDNLRNFIILIDPKPTDELKEKPDLYKESTRLRALIREHLRKLRLDSLFVVDNLDQMLETSLILYQATKLILSVSHFNPHRKPR